MKCLTIAAMALSLGSAAAQLPPEEVRAAADKVRAATNKAHLVGHEDEEVLARIEAALAQWDPRNLTSPYVKKIETDRGRKHALRRPDLAEFIADPDAALALGKALFWEMRAGSDYGSKGVTADGRDVVFGTACASCHYRFGADARDRNTAALALPSWESFVTTLGLPVDQSQDVPFAQRSRKFDPATDGSVSRNSWEFDRLGNSHRLVGSQGVVYRLFGGLNADGTEIASPVPRPANSIAFRDMFALGPWNEDSDGSDRTRQITRRNSPSIINAVFGDRQFHDARAESTFNGYSIFGDYDKRVILKKASFTRKGDPSEKAFEISAFHPASVAIPLASLASQAVGPIVNEIEMSSFGRTFHDLAVKLLGVTPLEGQSIPPNDSLLSGYLEPDTTYRTLIQQAFRAEWWADDGTTPAEGGFTPLNSWVKKEVLDRGQLPTPKPPEETDRLLVNNFSLFWGLSIMLYQSVLVSNESPFDDMLRGRGDSVEAAWRRYVTEDVARLDADKNVVPPEPQLPGAGGGGVEHPDDVIRKAQLDKWSSLNAPPVLTGTAMFQRGLRVFVRNCAECHTPPYFTNAGELSLGPDIPKPIAKLHGHSLVRTALADAFKERLITEGFHPGGVTDRNRHLLGNRLFFFDQERLPVIEALGLPLMIEFMPIDPAPPPRQPRSPMITWRGTRPPLEFAPSPLPGAKPLDPYAFYDLGYYNIGVSEPRYDWGIWAFDGLDDLVVTTQGFQKAVAPAADAMLFQKMAASPSPAMKDIQSLQPLIAPGVLPEIKDRTLVTEAVAEVARQLAAAEEGFRQSLDLGSAYQLPREETRQTPAEPAALDPDDMNTMLERAAEKMRQIKEFEARHETPPEALLRQPVILRDHTGDRHHLSNTLLRKDHHFFKRARRMVMSEETWGHRKLFISDSELMGWGAFKTPSLRNTALTEPYMHNGRFLTLRQVLRFYSADFHGLIPADPVRNPDLHPQMGRLDLNHDGRIDAPDGTPTGTPNLTQIHDAESLLFFLHCLTDPRVEQESAPFDHPSLIVPNGFHPDTTPPQDLVIEISASHSGNTSPPAQFPASQ